MVDAPLEPQAAPPTPACRRARLLLATLGYLNLGTGVALVAIMLTIGIAQSRGGTDRPEFTDPLYYFTWVPLVAFLAILGFGYLRLGRGVAQGLLRSLAAAKGLAMINLTVALIAAAGIVFGIIVDPPKPHDLPFLAVVCAVEALFIVLLAITIRSLNRAQRRPQPPPASNAANHRSTHP